MYLYNFVTSAYKTIPDSAQHGYSKPYKYIINNKGYRVHKYTAILRLIDQGKSSSGGSRPNRPWPTQTHDS
jgi:hypothetical protein